MSNPTQLEIVGLTINKGGDLLVKNVNVRSSHNPENETHPREVVVSSKESFAWLKIGKAILSLIKEDVSLNVAGHLVFNEHEVSLDMNLTSSKRALSRRISGIELNSDVIFNIDITEEKGAAVLSRFTESPRRYIARVQVESNNSELPVVRGLRAMSDMLASSIPSLSTKFEVKPHNRINLNLEEFV